MSTIDERIEAVEADGYPVCPNCQQLMDRTHPGTPLRDGTWTPRTCSRCGRSWRVFVRDEGRTRRVTGYEQRIDEPGLMAGEGTDAMKKNQTPDTASQKQADQKTEKQSKQPKAPRKAAAATTEPTVELLITADGIESLTAGARPGLKTPDATKKAKAPATPKPAEPPAVPEQPSDEEDLVVFAFRLTRAERDAIHHAAGAAKASKFARNLLVACARGDGGTVQQILETLQAPKGAAKK